MEKERKLPVFFTFQPNFGLKNPFNLISVDGCYHCRVRDFYIGLNAAERESASSLWRECALPAGRQKYVHETETARERRWMRG